MSYEETLKLEAEGFKEYHEGKNCDSNPYTRGTATGFSAGPRPRTPTPNNASDHPLLASVVSHPQPMNDMIDVTTLCPDQARARRVGKIRLTEQAYKDVMTVSEAEQVPLEGILRAVADSVVSHVTGDYFKWSSWFRRQKLHDVVGFFVVEDKVKTPHHFLMAKQSGGQVVLSFSEATLPTDYWVERVIEEAKVEDGISS